jgi:BlaI family transcriptional regulator, penicillinase repressor
MAAKSTPKPPRPSDGELAILQALWDSGPATVRAIHESMPGAQETGYTTTLKLLQIMLEKGLVTRDDSARSHIYQAAVEGEKVRRSLLGDLAQKAFQGSAGQLALCALGSGKISAAEREAIRKLLDD